jgi:hypothetical protein
VLCVGSKFDEHDEGLAYFYTQKKDSEEERVADYVILGPALPCPDSESVRDGPEQKKQRGQSVKTGSNVQSVAKNRAKQGES